MSASEFVASLQSEGELDSRGELTLDREMASRSPIFWRPRR